MKKLKILKAEYYPTYLDIQKITIPKHLRILQRKSISDIEFPINVAQSAVYSSQIEGNPIDLGTYLQYKEMNIQPKTKSFAEIQDLIKAYEFAQKHPLSFQNVLAAHKILSKELLKGTGYCGIVRDKGVSVYEGYSGRMIYKAADHGIIKAELEKLFFDIDQLLKEPLPEEALFYYASQIHLRFVQIHPFADGNGRSSRLIEKWFISQFLGKLAWNIHSERYYFLNLKAYYRTINLGKSYEVLQYEHCLPFLCLLPKALRYSYKTPRN